MPIQSRPTHYSMAVKLSSQQAAMATPVLFILRFIQQSSLVLTGFLTAYFIYWHNTLRDPVPLPLIGLLTAVPPLSYPSSSKLTTESAPSPTSKIASRPAYPWPFARATRALLPTSPSCSKPARPAPSPSAQATMRYARCLL